MINGLQVTGAIDQAARALNYPWDVADQDVPRSR